MSDIVAVLERLKGELTCSICRELLREPKTLPCLHSFCQECLEGHVRARPLDEELDPPDTRAVVPCPNCNFRAGLSSPSRTNESSGGVSGLRTNHCLKNLVQHFQLGQEVVGRSQKAKSRCSLCSQADNEAVAFCQTCNKFLDQVCLTAHKRMTQTSKHRVISLEDARLISGKDGSAPVVLSHKTWKCSEHFAEGEDDPNDRMSDMIMYCNDCKEVICCMCALAHHQGHSPNFTRIVIKHVDHQPRIEGEIWETNTTLENVDTSCLKLHQRIADIEIGREKTEKKIGDKFTKLSLELEKEKDSLLQSIDKMHRLHSHNLQVQREELDKKRKAIDRTLKFVERRLALGTAEDMVYFTKEMIEQMSSLVDEAKHHPPQVAYRREITFVQGDFNMTGVMGTVSAEPWIEIFTADDLDKLHFVRNRETGFTITARDVLRNVSNADDEMVLVELCPVAEGATVEGAELEVIKATVERMKNGKCLVTLKPLKAGPHILKIQVAEAGSYKHIKDSPHHVDVAIQPGHWIWEA